jgi:trigger factor
MTNGKLGSMILFGIVIVGLVFWAGVFGYQKKTHPYDATSIESAAIDSRSFTNYELGSETYAAQKGDAVMINYVGTRDDTGEAFEGGTANDYLLVLGSNSFIPGFEDQLIGATPGSDVTVHVTFPPDYTDPSLAGQNATFQCHVTDILIPQ